MTQVLDEFGRGKRFTGFFIVAFLSGSFLSGYDIVPILPYFAPLAAFLFGADVYQEKGK